MKSTALVPLLLSTIPLVTAAACTRSNARAWPQGATSCNGNAACINLALEGQCNAQTYIDGGKCVKKRATTLNCGAGEYCYLYTDGDLLCIDWTSGAYRDDAGGQGNAFSGVYTAADGAVTTNLGGAATATTRRTTGTATAATTTTGAGSGGAAGQQTVTTAVAATRTNAAAGNFRPGAAAVQAAWAVAGPVLVLLAA